MTRLDLAGKLRANLRANRGLPITLGRTPPRVRRAEEFEPAVTRRAPRDRGEALVWDLEKIRKARDLQMQGKFAEPVRMAAAMRTDDALFVAYENRVAPVSAVESRLVPTGGERGKAVARKAEASVFVSRTTLADINGTLANHGVAVARIQRQPHDDGTQVDFIVDEWPLEFVEDDTTLRTLTTTVDGGATRIPITHGDGEWVVFRKHKRKPWTKRAAVLPGSLIWAAHASGLGDWSASSLSHGLAKIVGELPAGLTLQNGDGSLTPEATAFLRMLQDLVSGEAGAALRPAGAKTDFLANGSTAWQIFHELIMNREKAAARVYLGTDAILGSVGGAPGVDIAALFGVATTIIQGDFTTLEQGLNTGVYEPWTAINEGDSRYAPKFRFQLPDPAAERKAEQRQTRRLGLIDVIKAYKAEGFQIDQDVIDALAAELGVENPPQLAEIAERTAAITLAPTDVAKIVTVNEARAGGLGLGPFHDERGKLTITELDELAKASAAPPAEAPPPAAAPPA